MSAPEKKRGKRTRQPDLSETASAAEYTGALPALPAEDMPDGDGKQRQSS